MPIYTVSNVLDLSGREIDDEVGMLSASTKTENERRLAAQAAAKPGEKVVAPGLPRADHVIVATGPRAPDDRADRDRGISDKSRDPLEYRFDAGDEAAFRKQVRADAQEAIDKYGGQVEIRSSKFNGRLNGRSVAVRRTTLLYDDTALDLRSRTAIHTEDNFLGVQVIFSDQLGIPR